MREDHQISALKLSNCGKKNTGNALIKTINNYMYSTGFLTKNQKGFIPQRSTSDVNKALKFCSGRN